MAETNLFIKIHLKNDAVAGIQKLQNDFAKFAKEGEKLTRQMKMVGREISQVGMTLTAVGASITAPLVLAFKSVEEKSYRVWQVMEKFRNSTENLRISIAESLVPVMDKLVNMLGNLVDKWLSLDPALRDQIIQFAMWTGVILTLSGTVGLLVGKFVQFLATVGNLAFKLLSFANANLLLAAGIGVIIYACGRWDSALITVANTAELLFSSFKNGLNAIKVVFLGFADLWMRTWALIASGMDKITFGLFHTQLDEARRSFDDFRKEVVDKELEKAFKELTRTSEETSKALENLATGNAGKFADGALKIKKQVQPISDKIKELFGVLKTMSLDSKSGSEGNNGMTFFEGFSVGLEKMSKEFADFGKLGQKVAGDVVNAWRSGFSDLFYNVFTGQLTSMKDVFLKFGQSLIRIFSDTLAQMTVEWLLFGRRMQSGGGSSGGGLFGSILGILGGLGGMFGGIGGGMSSGITETYLDPTVGSWGPPTSWHRGGIVKAHNGLAVDEVPAVLQSGEGVLSRKGMKNLAKLNNGGSNEEGTQPIVVFISAWDTRDLERNRKSIENIFIDSFKRNSKVRGTVKEYR